MILPTLTDEQLDELIKQKSQPTDLSNLSDTELDRMIVEKSGQQPILRPSRQQLLEKRIAQRPDIYRQAEEAIQQIPRTAQAHPFQTPLIPADILLKSAGGVAQRAEATVFNPFIEMGRGRYEQMLPSIKRGITGEQLGELGDVARQAGVPEPIAATIGLIGTGILSGAIAKWAGLTTKADNLVKLQTTYGDDIASNAIRQTTETPMPLVKRGMRRGWRRILTKENAKDLSLPTRKSQYVMSALDNITQSEYDEFGKVINKVKTGNVKAIDLNQEIQNTLVKNGYLDANYNPTLKMKGNVSNKIFDFIENAQKSGMKPDDNIPISVIQRFKDILKSFVPEKNWIGKTRSLKGEQRLAKELSQNLDNLIAYNAYGIEDEAYSLAKRRYSEFKNFESQILNTFSEVVGQETKATADKVIGLSKIHPTKMIEEMDKLYNIDQFLKSKGYSGIADNLLDWMTTQEMLIEPEGGVFKRLYEAPVKYGARQILRTGVPTMMGKTGQVVNRYNIIPASVLKTIQQPYLKNYPTQ